MSAPWLVDQTRRTAVLAELEIMDTPSEKVFDDLALRATKECNTPVGLVSFVAEDRQWFKARVGFAACETPIGQSVCKYTLDHFGLLIIPDLTKDERTKENPLVIGEPYIRFYAGARIIAIDGTAIGSLCVIDFFARPEGLTVFQTKALQDLALECSSTVAMLHENKKYDPHDSSEKELSLRRIVRLDHTIKAQHHFLQTIPDPDTRGRAEANLISIIMAVAALRETHEQTFGA